jgi:hypothetical protein
MNAQLPPVADPDTEIMLDCLRRAVSQALERKRRLGQYAVFWDGKGPVAVGEDAPPMLRAPQRASED